MDELLTFLQPMYKGHRAEGAAPAECDYCMFTSPISAPVVRQCISGDSNHLTLELTYGGESLPGELRLYQMGTNVVIEESTPRAFCTFLQGQECKYIGQLLMLALRFKIRDLTARVETSTENMKSMENALDNCIDNSGTYQILDFRRQYTEYGNQLIAVKEILARIEKGYYPMQMQNSYVLQGQVMLEFHFLEERYALVKGTIIKDLDTYTSIINNNLSRNTRLLSIISLVGVVLNFVFGGLLSVCPLLGIVGGLAIGTLSVVASVRYRFGGRNIDTIDGTHGHLHVLPPWNSHKVSHRL